MTFSQIKKFSEDSAHSYEQEKVSDRPKSESRILVCPFTVQRQLSDKFSAIYSRP